MKGRDVDGKCTLTLGERAKDGPIEMVVTRLSDRENAAYRALDPHDQPGEPAQILRVDETPGSRCGWRLERFPPAPGFVAAVVAEGRRP
jgi:hypothetical protein